MTGEQLDPALREALLAVARTSSLLVASDYDGTLAAIVDDPSAARPHPGSISALVALSALERTTVAVVTGRSLRALATLVTLPDTIRRVGSHGSEFDDHDAPPLDPDALLLRSQVIAAAAAIADPVPGVMLEAKPAGVAVHVRRAARPDARRVTEAVLAGPATIPGVHVIEGKEVVELSVLATDKGAALDLLRRQAGAEAVVFLGDDVTDERAFSRLVGSDVGVKVGPGTTLAAFRVSTTAEAGHVLEMLGEERARFLRASRPDPGVQR